MQLTLAFREQLDPWTREELDRLVTHLNAAWESEFADIIATTLNAVDGDFTGDLTVHGNLTVEGATVLDEVTLNDSVTVNGAGIFPGTDGSGNNLGLSSARWDEIYSMDIFSTNGYHEHGRSAAMGEWTTFTPTRTAGAGTWTGGTVTTAHYTLIGKTMIVTLEINASTNSAVTGQFNITIPGSFTAAKDCRNWIKLNDGGAATATHGEIVVAAGGTSLVIIKFDGTNFAANTGTLYVRGQVAFEVQ